ncbi:MAG: hypothetical protein KAX58_03680 [Aeromonadaceae bacterium]|nr:hypothetical protein [Aeromonadaceae bacterium]
MQRRHRHVLQDAGTGVMAVVVRTRAMLLAVITFVMRVSRAFACRVNSRILKPACQYVKDRQSHQHCDQQYGDDFPDFE